jgi:hypothetical protein
MSKPEERVLEPKLPRAEPPLLPNVIWVVDQSTSAANALRNELRRQLGNEYRIVAHDLAGAVSVAWDSASRQSHQDLALVAVSLADGEDQFEYLHRLRFAIPQGIALITYAPEIDQHTRELAIDAGAAMGVTSAELPAAIAQTLLRMELPSSGDWR